MKMNSKCYFLIIVLVFFYFILSASPWAKKNKKVSLSLFDFTSGNADLSEWSEQSDSATGTGESKSVFVLYETKVFRRAVLFTLLTSKESGDSFSGYRTSVQFNLSNYKKLQLRVRAQGANTDYKVILQHNGQNDEPYLTYENVFQAPVKEFEEISLLLSDFVPCYNGRKLNLSIVVPLDLKNITSFEIQTYGGLYTPIKKCGVSALEIDWVKAI